MAKPPSPSLSLTVQYASAVARLPLRARLRRWVRATLGSDVVAAAITLRFVDTEEGRRLNRDYRGKDQDHATNVLSFPYAPQPHLAGDLVLCAPVVFAEASEQGKLPEAHIAHLVVHGMLHLQGYDHQAETDATLMEGREREILATLGFPDPY